jgi:hypothetical protein
MPATNIAKKGADYLIRALHVFGFDFDRLFPVECRRTE